MSRFTLTTPFAAALALCLAAGAGADRLLSPTALPEAQLDLVSESGARAFDHIRAARQQIETRHPVEARAELTRARKLLSEARAAIPANRVQDRIAALIAHVEDPSQPIAVTDVDTLLAEIETAGAGDAYDASRRYVERARYFLYHGDRDAAARELVAAAARVPYGRLDAPLGASYERVNQAMVYLYDHDLESADSLLEAAEDDAHAVIQIAAGESWMLPDVAAPPAPAPEPMGVEVIEEEIAPDAPFAPESSSESMGEPTPTLGESMGEPTATSDEEAADAMGETADPTLPDVAAPAAAEEAAEAAAEEAEAAAGEAAAAGDAAREDVEAALPDVAAPPTPGDAADATGEAAAEEMGEAAEDMGAAAEEMDEAVQDMGEDLMDEQIPEMAP